jgi:hypothetical protein
VGGLGKSLQAFGEHFGAYAQAHAKVAGHFEEAAWDYRGFVFFAKVGDEGVGVALFQARERGCAEFGGDSYEGLAFWGGVEVG